MRFELSAEPWAFGSARDAIDAVSAFEAATLHDWEYQIECACDDPEEWRVRLNCITGKPVRGYLAPMGQ